MSTSPSPIPLPTAREWLLWLIRRRLRMRVTGESMQPILMPGDLVLVDRRAYTADLPKPGDVVVARHPHQKNLTIIKRVVAVSEDERLDLRSENSGAGSDSRQFGLIPRRLLIGRVTSRIPPP